MSFFKSAQGKADRFIDRLRSLSPVPRSQSSSPLPPLPSPQQQQGQHETQIVEYRPSEQLADADSAAPDTSSPPIALLVTTPSHPLSPASPDPVLAPASVPASTPSELPTPSTLILRPVGQLVRDDSLSKHKPNAMYQTINSSNSNVNNNAPGGTMINNSINNSITHIFSRDQAADDMKTIEKGELLGHISQRFLSYYRSWSTARLPRAL